MLVERKTASARSLLFVNTLLLSTSVALPALAQVEQVVVTAQRRTEDIQNVPIAITAFSEDDLKAHQIQMAKDLQFATPNVTYSKTNFSGDDFTIRGIGNDVITGGGESGVSVSFDNIYLAGAALDLSSFFDTQRIEVLEGPQSSLYGRGATAGSVNIIPNKPDLENAYVTADASYGNYNQNEDHLVVNLPIDTDHFGVRVAIDREFNDGLIDNEYNGTKIDGNNTLDGRFSVRWEPSDNTLLDVVGDFFHKNDTTMRSQRQQCLYDPSGTLGCLPGGLANQGININAFFAADIASNQSFEQLGLPGTLGLIDLTKQAPEVFNPSQPWHVNTDFQPFWQADSQFLALNFHQKLTSWLDLEANIGYSHSESITQESYNNSVPQVIPAATLGVYAPNFGAPTSEGTLYNVLATNLGTCAFCNTAYANLYAPYFSHVGMLPASNFNGLGISTSPNNAKYYTNGFSTYDQSNAAQKQWSADIRFASHLDGPFNFMLGTFYLQQYGFGDYFVSSGAQGYGSVALGSILGLIENNSFGDPQCLATGCTSATPFYDNTSPPSGGVTLKSKSGYGEVYYDIVPDLLKLTLGARWTEDYKSQIDQIFLVNKIVPVGTPNEAALTGPLNGTTALSAAECAVLGSCNVPLQFLNQRWDRWTGRAVLDYTPQLDFTDHTLIYASYARGYKAGGFNPGLSTFAIGSGVSEFYQPEGIDAFELGTKNTLLHQTLQANGDIWYYNYEGLQISQILDNDSINANVNSRMYGGEGQFIYAPDEHWAINLNLGYTHSALGDNYLVDPRNPTAGLPNAILVKDSTLSGTAAQNCAIYLINGQTTMPGDNGGLTAALGALKMANPYFDPPGGPSTLSSDGIPHTSYGSCNPSFFTNPQVIAAMNANGYAFSLPGNPNATAGGVAVNLKGNQNPNSPPFTLSLGVQYTFNLGGDYTLVPRADFYFQTQMWGRVFEDPADKISGFTVTNIQVQLNAPDSQWYVQGFVKNVFDRTYVTGEYLTSSSSGLYTNQFLGDPRMYGVRVGIHF